MAYSDPLIIIVVLSDRYKVPDRGCKDVFLKKSLIGGSCICEKKKRRKKTTYGETRVYEGAIYAVWYEIMEKS